MIGNTFDQNVARMLSDDREQFRRSAALAFLVEMAPKFHEFARGNWSASAERATEEAVISITAKSMAACAVGLADALIEKLESPKA